MAGEAQGPGAVAGEVQRWQERSRGNSTGGGGGEVGGSYGLPCPGTSSHSRLHGGRRRSVVPRAIGPRRFQIGSPLDRRHLPKAEIASKTASGARVKRGEGRWEREVACEAEVCEAEACEAEAACEAEEACEAEACEAEACSQRKLSINWPV